MNLEEISSAVGTTIDCLKENHKSKIIQDRLKEIEVMYKTLEWMVGSKEGAMAWLRAPNPDYNNMFPVEIISRGNADSIIRYLDDIKKGALT